MWIKRKRFQINEMKIQSKKMFSEVDSLKCPDTRRLSGRDELHDFVSFISNESKEEEEEEKKEKLHIS